MHILTYSDIIKHIQAYSGIIRAYSEPCVTLAYLELWYFQNPGISKTLVHSEPQTYSESWAIQNPGIFRSEREAYSEIYQISTMERFEKHLTAIIIFTISAFYAL